MFMKFVHGHDPDHETGRASTGKILDEKSAPGTRLHTFALAEVCKRGVFGF